MTTPNTISRTKIQLFLDCPRCFYLDVKLGVKRPSGPPFTLNVAVDHLLKKEFDIHRAAGTQHPLLAKYGVDAHPVPHERLGDWRENFKGVRYFHELTDLTIFGAIDDLWQTHDGHFIVVDYKATSRMAKVEELGEGGFYQAYRNQMEIYQWLLRHNGLTVSDTGYFVYCNGIKDKAAFDAKLEFDLTLIPYTGKDDWVEPTIIKIKHLLDHDVLPDSGLECQFCAYREAAGSHE